MSLTKFTTEQYEDKSVTSAKLEDDITVRGNLRSNLILSSVDPFTIYNTNGTVEYKLLIGDDLELNGSTLGSTTGTGLFFKSSQTDNFANPIDLLHIDTNGNVYIKGDLNIGGTVNSVTTTVDTMEVADYEIILNSGVTTPFMSGGKLTVNRGGSNYDPYLAWDETNKYWSLYDGTNTARIIDNTYGDSLYVNIGGDTMTGPLTISGSSGALTLKAGASADHVYIQLYADSQAQNTRSGYIGYGSGGTNLLTIANEMTNGNIHFLNNGSGLVSTSGNISVGGDVTITGNKLSFGNGSYISNETDTALEIKGDGTIFFYGDSSTTNRVIINNTFIGVGTTTDSNARAIINSADGKIGFGPGNATRDTWLYRDAVNSLKTDGILSTGTKLNVGTDLYVAGNAGIGVTSPSSKLHVLSGSALTGVYKDTYATEIIDASEGRLQVRASEGGGSWGSALILSTGANSWSFAHSEASQSNKLFLGYRTSAADEDIVNASAKLVTFQTDGNVGVGTPTPTAKLHVNGGDIKVAHTANENATTLLSDNTGRRLWLHSSGQDYIEVAIATSFDNDKKVDLFYTPGTIGAGAGVFKIGQIDKNNANFTHGVTALYTNGLERARIDKDGNFGVGTTSPASMLDVNGDVETRGSFKASASDGTDKFEIKYDSTTKALSFNFIG